jgi:hypothetical protein
MRNSNTNWTPGRTLNRFIAAGFAVMSFVLQAAADAPTNTPRLLLVLGAPGQSEYGSNFVTQAELWENACKKARFSVEKIGLQESPLTNDWELLRTALASETRNGPIPLWLVLIGHGSFDGKEARFNLRGPDLTATNLAEWLLPFRRPLMVLNMASCSAPFLNKLSGTNRVIITATRSGHEQYFTRFGEHFARALQAPEADLDKDGGVSVLEAFLIASHRTAEFYKTEGRLATEHALLDDNGDGLGTQGDWFRGLRAVKKPADKASVDGMIARQVQLIPSPEDENLSVAQKAARNDLEQAVFALREKKSQLPAKEYNADLERLLLSLANLYEQSSSVK